MHDVILTPTRSDRLLVAVSLALFGVAGALSASVDELGPTLGATTLAIAGVYTLAKYANSVSRRTLASLALVLWTGFIAVATLHVIGLQTIGAAVPGPTAVLVIAVTAATWALLLTACSTTAFLGFREYGTTVSTETLDEQSIESEPSDYSTR